MSFLYLQINNRPQYFYIALYTILIIIILYDFIKYSHKNYIMKRLYYLIYISFLVPCIACQQEPEIIPSDCKTIKVPLPTELSVNDIEAYEIPLSCDAPLSMIRGGIEMNDRFYLIDDNGREVFVFDLQGNYIGRISNSGRSNKEYVQINQIFPDHKNNRILLLDNMKFNLHVYNEDLTLERVIPVGYFPSGFAAWDNNYAIFDFCGKNERNNPIIKENNVTIIDDNGEILYGFSACKTPNPIKFIMSQNIKILSDGQIRFTPPFSNIIYSISGKDSLKAEYAIDLSNFNRTLSSQESSSLEHIMTPDNSERLDLREYEKKGYTFWIGFFRETKDHLLIRLGYHKNLNVIFNKNTKSIKTYDVEANHCSEILDYSTIQSNNYLYFIIYPINQKEKYKETIEGLGLNYEDINNRENPTLIRCKFKI